MSRPTILRIATRASQLARAQAEAVAEQLRERLGMDTALVPVTTAGDKSHAPLTQIGGQGVFVGGVRQALIDGAADVAVHSLKDLPSFDDDRIALAAVPTREDPADCLVSEAGGGLDGLPLGARVGTGSLRRGAQLLAARPDLQVVPIRGNIETRLAKVHAGEVDAVVLARAGLVRLCLLEAVTEVFSPEQMLPAPGQGALAVEVAASSVDLTAELASVLDDPATRAAVSAERALLRTLGAGCSAPVGALALADGDPADRADTGQLRLTLTGVVAAPDGSRVVRRTSSGPATAAERLGHGLATELLAQGAGELTPAAVSR